MATHFSTGSAAQGTAIQGMSLHGISKQNSSSQALQFIAWQGRA
jgi:hypothetical protein